MINITNESGTIRITDDVFTNLAGDAATSCFGVKGMAGRSKDGGPLQLLRRESMSKGVVVHYNDEDDSISLELHIGVDHGVNMAAVSRSIMKEVSYKLFKATGIDRAHTDLHNDKYKQKDVYEDKVAVNANDAREIAEPRNLTFDRGERIQTHIDTSALDDEQARYYHDGNKKNDLKETFVQRGARFIGSGSRFRGE